MIHRFKNTCIDPIALLDGVDTLSKFIRRAKKQSEDQVKVNPGYWEPIEYFGDAFEAFCEVLINASPIDKRINISNYVPTTPGKDNGVDGVGTTHDGKIHTVQCKASSNPTKYLTANWDRLSNFVANSTTTYNGNLGKMTIYTTAGGINHHIAHNMYNDQVQCIGYKILSKMVDGNQAFWTLFLKELI